MPFSNRVLNPPLSYREFQFKEIQDTRLELTMEKFSMMSMEGTLLQFARITRLAHDVFSSLAKDCGTSLNRCKALSTRMDSLSTIIKEIPDTELANRIFVKTEATESHTLTSKFLFMAKSRNEATLELYEKASKPPALDSFSGDGSCLKKYSDPFFFMEKWIEQERQKQEEAAERRRKRREARKLKKKNKQQKTDDKGSKQRIVVDRVERKKYNIYGPEFGDDEAAHIPVPQGRLGASENLPGVIISTHEADEHAHKRSLSRSGTLKHVGAVHAPPLPPPPKGAVVLPVDVSAVDMTAPAAPVAPSAPAAGPVGLLGQIKSGVSLKKAQVTAPVPKKRGLLDEIRSGKALKKVEIGSKMERRKSNAAEEAGGVFGEISKLMERRKFIEDSGDEDSDDDDWDE